MADFRKFLPALALSALVAIGSMPAAAQLTCNTNSSGQPFVRGEGRTELVGDIVLSCDTKGVPSPGVTANVFRVLLNTPITSPYTGTIGTATSTAQLIIDDIVVSAQAGRQTASNVLEWYGVPVMGVGSTSRIIRIVNVRADATAVVSINPNIPPSLIPSQIVAFLSADPSSALPINNPQQVVALAKQSLATSVGGALNLRQCLTVPVPTGVPSSSGSISLNFTELFTTAFRQQLDPVRVGNSVPGAAYFDESGFINSNIIGATAADSGTPFRVKFDNIPAGATVYVSTVATSTATNAVTATLNNGALTTSAWVALTATGASATADYYVVDAPLPSSGPDPNTVTVYASIAYTADPANNIPAVGGSPLTVTLSYGPGLSSARIPYSLPSFSPTATTSAGNLITISPCVTNLLFPYVVSDGANFDTGIAISNTSKDGANGDVFATATSGQTGICKVWFFGTGAPSGPQTTPSIAAGSVYGFSLFSGDSTNGASIAPISALTGGGYAIAKCNFQFAHGYAFIQNVGLPTKFAQSYLALVIPDRGGARSAQDASTATGDAGEMLAQ